MSRPRHTLGARRGGPQSIRHADGSLLRDDRRLFPQFLAGAGGPVSCFYHRLRDAQRGDDSLAQRLEGVRCDGSANAGRARHPRVPRSMRLRVTCADGPRRRPRRLSPAGRGGRPPPSSSSPMARRRHVAARWTAWSRRRPLLTEPRWHSHVRFGGGLRSARLGRDCFGGRYRPRHPSRPRATST